jgi:hypothetical protein
MGIVFLVALFHERLKKLLKVITYCESTTGNILLSLNEKCHLRQELNLGIPFTVQSTLLFKTFPNEEAMFLTLVA